MSTIKEDPFCHNHTFVLFFLFFDVFTFFPLFEYSGSTNWSRIPEYRSLVTTVLSITLDLICFMIVIKFVAWMLRRSEKGKKFYGKYDIKSSGKVDSYDKWQLLFGYYSMTFLTILLQVAIWWVDYDNDLGFFAAVVYYILSLAIHIIFIFGPAYQYEFKYLPEQVIWGYGIILFSTLVTLPSNGYPGFLRHFFLNIMLAIFITELQCVQNDRILIDELNVEDSEDMENGPDCSGMSINSHF